MPPVIGIQFERGHGRLPCIKRQTPPEPPAKKPSMLLAKTLVYEFLDKPYLSWVKDTRHDDLPTPPKDTRPLRVLILGNTLAVGGAERLALDMGNVLVKAGHSVTFGLNHKPTFDCGLTVLPQDEAVSAGVYDVALLVNLNGCDHVPALAASGCKVLGLPYGLVSWNIQQMGHNEALLKDITFWAYPKIAAGLKALGVDNKCYPMRGFTNDAKYTPAKISVGKPVLAFIGRISPEKNIQATCKLASMLGAPLHIIGGVDPGSPEDHRVHFQKCIDTVKASSEWCEAWESGLLIEHGYCGDVPSLLKKVKPTVVVLTSDFEGEPLVFLEAMSRGILCAGRDVCSVGDALRGSGVLSTPVSRKISAQELLELARGIQAAHSSRDAYKELVDEGREKVLQDYSPAAWLESFHRVCRAVGVFA